MDSGPYFLLSGVVVSAFNSILWILESRVYSPFAITFPFPLSIPFYGFSAVPGWCIKTATYFQFHFMDSIAESGNLRWSSSYAFNSILWIRMAQSTIPWLCRPGLSIPFYGFTGAPRSVELKLDDQLLSIPFYGFFGVESWQQQYRRKRYFQFHFMDSELQDIQLMASVFVKAFNSILWIPELERGPGPRYR